MTLRVLVVDDQALVRAGFRLILDAQPQIEVVAEASDGAEAVAAATGHRPDVVLMDIRMPVMDGIEATRRIVGGGSAARVLILTTYDLDEYVFDALDAGASGFLLKDVPPEELVHAVGLIARGEALLAPSATRALIAAFSARARPQPPRPVPELRLLTPREAEILELMATGLSNTQMAETLYVSENTIKTHVARIFDKLGLRDRVQAVILAYDCGLVRPAGG